jgi:RNA polymerase sigma-70 factor, ECF subfamily
MAVSSPGWTDDQELLAAARAGDEDAFSRIADDHRAELFAHCYRMLGSTEDAEDVVQEVLVRVWRGLRKFAGQSSLRTWLYRIATNACLDAIGRRPKRVLPIDHGPASEGTDDPGPPLTESVWIEPFPDEALGLPEGYAAPDARYEQHEAVELAFIAALQLLPATQRAVLVLREVLGFSAREVSESLETTVASVNSALQRARKTLEERLPDRSQQETVRSLGDGRVRELVESYSEAWRKGDVEGLRALLAEEAVFSMPPWAAWWRGRDTIAGFAASAAESLADIRWTLVRANGQTAIACYHPEEGTGRWVPLALDVLTFEGDRISEITAFLTPNFFSRFGLPAELPQSQ